MIHAPATNPYPFNQPASDPRTRDVSPLAVALPAPAPITMRTPSDSSLVDQSGRVLGPRALKTRARILDATLILLDEKSMRNLRVIDIARRIGSSPATFYQYFKDVEDVVLELAARFHDAVPAMVEVIRGDWHGREGYERGRRLARLCLEHWGPYSAILRVRNNAAEEGDEAFNSVRLQTLLPIVTALSDIIREKHPVPDPNAVDWQGGDLHPISAAFMLTGALEGMIQHQVKFEKRFAVEGEGADQIADTVASLFQLLLT
jgi:AcrR family transcriptional regulator